MMLDRSLLSVVVPIYNEEATLPELERRLPSAVEGLGFDDCEFLLISDGSADASEDLIRQMAARDPRYRGIFLTRNFGHQAAVSTGLTYARGSVVAIIDGDLQDPPEAIATLIDALEHGADVAYGIRSKRKEHLFKRAAYFTFYRMLRALSAIDIPLDTGDFCVMRRRVVEAMLTLPERNRFVRGLRAWVGYQQVGVPYERAARFAGAPKYTLRKLLGLAYDGLFSFTNLPVRLIQMAGFLLSGVAILIAISYVVWFYLAPEQFPPGFASLMVSIWFFAGVQLLCLGIVGEYVVRTCSEVRARPIALVREVVGQPTAGPTPVGAPASPRKGDGDSDSDSDSPRDDSF
ncbi:glycosyltransferase family 2 protein [Tautonia sociabilis]|uniref:Glycosyltransferase n=1 Tax=Tautonia sociabilis TaxID=2080755 RepID=A0A432MG85_9BACT|nr:glycosyltransferase family 2 protein [Tautonia sociabilis]RUL85595.1 glycosyltransferase [Tautonia sociabilis]